VAVDTVLNFLKEKLPVPIAAQLDTVLNLGGAGDIGKTVGNLFG
jgi:hypothetical protein